MDSQGVGYCIRRNLLCSHEFYNPHDEVLHDKPLCEVCWHQHRAFQEVAPHAQELESLPCFRPRPESSAVTHCNDTLEGLGSISRPLGGEL